jgi:DNA-binding NarL/FixJ family response regulator
MALPTSISPKNALVADDNAFIRQKVCAMFVSQGFAACIEASDGKEAIRLADISKPDIIILDLSMPNMNGIEAAPHLRAIVPDTPIIIFTLFGDQIKKGQFDRLGISAIVLKTDGLDKFLIFVRELMGPEMK